MTVPLVAAFSACTSTYGRLAPLPPVAATAGWAPSAKTTPMVISEVVPTRATARLSFLMGWNIWCSFRHGHAGSAPSVPLSGGVGGGARARWRGAWGSGGRGSRDGGGGAGGTVISRTRLRNIQTHLC